MTKWLTQNNLQNTFLKLKLGFFKTFENEHCEKNLSRLTPCLSYQVSVLSTSHGAEWGPVLGHFQSVKDGAFETVFGLRGAEMWMNRHKYSNASVGEWSLMFGAYWSLVCCWLVGEDKFQTKSTVPFSTKSSAQAKGQVESIIFNFHS